MSLFRTRGARSPAAWAALSLTLLAALAIALPPAGAAAAPVTWLASIGAAGANGQAAITAPATAGTAGSLKLALKGLSASTTYPVKVQKGTCAAPGSVVFTAPSQKSTAAGKISKVVPVPAAKMTAIRAATSLILRVGAGTKLRCGPFTGGMPRPMATPTPVPTVTAELGLSDIPMSIASTATSVWVAEMVGNSLVRVDPATNAIAQRAVLGEVLAELPLAVAIAADAIWVTGTTISLSPDVPGIGSLRRVDPSTGTVVATIPVGRGPNGLAVGTTGIWVGCGDGSVYRIDPSTNTVAWSAKIATHAMDLAVSSGSLWIADGTGKAVIRLDEKTGKVIAKVTTGGETQHIAASEAGVWATVDGTSANSPASVVRVDPATNKVASRLMVGPGLQDVAATDYFVWAISSQGELSWIDPASSTIAGRFSVGARATLAATASGRTLWLIVTGAPAIVRVDY